jgi:hypothetical protein
MVLGVCIDLDVNVECVQLGNEPADNTGSTKVRMAELADASDLKSEVRKNIRVRLPFLAPSHD